MQAYLHQKINMRSITAGKKAARTLSEPKKKACYTKKKNKTEIMYIYVLRKKFPMHEKV